MKPTPKNPKSPAGVVPLSDIGLDRLVACFVYFLVSCVGAKLCASDRQDLAQRYELEIQPILERHCYDCHADGADEGNFTLDHFESTDEALDNPGLWWRVVKNLRAGVMPPPGSGKVTQEELERIRAWVKTGPFKIDADHLDPGPQPVRRLNRAEYGNTIRELMGVPFNEKLLFPPDDSGHGFDNVADALMVSPLLLDKYLQAAEQVVDRAVPKATWIVPRQDFRGEDFSAEDRRTTGRSLNGKRPARVQRSVEVSEAGVYEIQIAIKQHGSFEFDPARYNVTAVADEEVLFTRELGWDENKRTQFEFQTEWVAGRHRIEFVLAPKEAETDPAELPGENSDTHVHFEVDTVSIVGPQGTERRVHPANYERFFSLAEPPGDPEVLNAYRQRTLSRFAHRAFRGPVKPVTVDRLVAIAEAASAEPDATFETGIARAMVAILASPRFLFRVPVDSGPENEGAHNGEFRLVDHWTLASRLSYFLWSSMPDEELFDLAKSGQLRAELDQQVERMLADERAEAFVRNFVGQWLRTRDVGQLAIDPAVILGYDQELEELRDWFRSRFSRQRRSQQERTPEDEAKLSRFREIRAVLDRIDSDLKRAMRRETEMFVEYVFKENKNMLDLIDCNYTFLNEKLAEHYGIDGVEGRDMRKVDLPSDSPRGGILTQASMLLVTSNPTRTSPVKRGLFVLDNLLGTPAPPAPAVVPELEASENRFADKKPTLRELLAVHRESSLCASCHARMDPLGLALENFDALGMWRETEAGQPIETQGELVTGEQFQDIRDLKKVLRNNHSQNFYRCVSEKLLIYAIGRGIEYTDEQTVDNLVQSLVDSQGQFRRLVQEVVRSAPFQRRRTSSRDTRTALLD